MNTSTNKIKKKMVRNKDVQDEKLKSRIQHTEKKKNNFEHDANILTISIQIKQFLVKARI